MNMTQNQYEREVIDCLRRSIDFKHEEIFSSENNESNTELSNVEDLLFRKYNKSPIKFSLLDWCKVIDALEFEHIKIEGYLMIVNKLDNEEMLIKIRSTINKIENNKLRDTAIKNFIINYYFINKEDYESGLNLLKDLSLITRKLEILCRAKEHYRETNPSKLSLIQQKIEELIIENNQVHDEKEHIDNIMQLYIFDNSNKNRYAKMLVDKVEKLNHEDVKESLLWNILKKYELNLDESILNTMYFLLPKSICILYDAKNIRSKSKITTKEIDSFIYKLNSNYSNCKFNKTDQKEIKEALLTIILGYIEEKSKSFNNLEDELKKALTYDRSSFITKICHLCAQNTDIHQMYIEKKCPQCGASVEEYAKYKSIKNSDNINICYLCGEIIQEENWMPFLVCSECSEKNDK